MGGGGISRSRAAAAFALVLTLNAVSAHAEPSASQIATAKSLVAEGRKQRTSGDHAAAKQKFKAAWALVPTPIIGLDLAKEHVALGELVEAREVCLEIARIAPSSKESAESQAARTEAKALEESLKPRIATLTVEVIGVPEGVPVRARIDGAPIPPEVIGVAQKLNPGKHVVILEAGKGHLREEVVTLVEGDTRTLRANFSGESFTKQDDAKPSSAPSPPKSPEGSSSAYHVAAWAGFTIAAAGAVACFLTIPPAIEKKRIVDEYEDKGTLKKAQIDDWEKARTWAVVSGVGVLLGLSVGIASLVLAPKDATRPALNAHIDSRTAYASATWRF